MTELLVFFGFLLPGFVISLFFLPLTQAIFASAIISGVLAVFSGIAHVWLDIPIQIMWIAASAIALTILIAISASRSRILTNLQKKPSWMEGAQLVVVGPIMALVSLLPPAPLGWDARSIWLFHASWLNGPASVFLDAQTLPAIAWSHPDYPLFGSAIIAILWALLGQTENLSYGLQIISAITVLTAALTSSLTMSRIAQSGNRWINLIAFILFNAVAFSLGGGLFNQAYMDALQAFLIVCLLSSLIPALQDRLSWPQAVLSGIIGVAAMSVKQEGFWFALTIILVMLLVTVRNQYFAKYLPLFVVTGFYALWKFFLESINSVQQSDVAGIGDRLPELLNADSTAWTILFRLTTNEGFSTFWKIAVVIVVFVTAMLVTQFNPTTIKLVALVVGSFLAIIAIIFLTYALSQTREKIDWWLATSYIRVISTPILLGWFTVFIGVISASDSWNKLNKAQKSNN